MPDDLADRLLEWSKTPDAARLMWAAWLECMKQQHRDVSRHQIRWQILEPNEQQFHGLMAQAFMSMALAGAEGEKHDGG